MTREKTIARAMRVVFSGSIALGFGLHAATAFAEDANTIPRVEITGSAIKRIAVEGALPVQQISQEAIARSGATTITELIQKLPAMQGFTIEAIAAGTNSGGRTSASLHDIGSEYTLVLLNGRRVAPAPGLGSAVNLNSIPLSAVERVEVLTDGASALYGSDAIAGVVNFILKKNYKGGTIDAEYVVPQKAGGASWNFGGMFGFGDLDEDRYNVLMSFRHDSQEQMKATQRDFAKTAYIPFGFNGNSYIYDRTSTATVPANVTVRFTTASKLPAISFSPYLKKNGTCPSMNVVSLTNNNVTTYQCAFDFVQQVEIVPESQRDSFFTTGRFKLNNDVTLFADLALSRFDLTARIASNPVPFTVPVTSQYYKDYVLPYLTPAQAAAVTTASGNYRAFDWGTRDSQTLTDSTHLVFGAEADLAGWNISSAVTLSKNEIDERYVGGYMRNTEFRNMLNNRSFDPFAPIGAQSDATKELIAASIYHGSIRTASSKLTGIDARASRELFALPGGAASLALGADYRQYKYVQTPSAAAVNGDVYNFSANPAYDMKRDTTGLFTEFLAPVIKDVELTASLRYDTYSAISDAIQGRDVGKSESASTYKISARYQPVNTLMLRGSFGTGFKAPSMLDIAQPLVAAGVTAGNYSCPIPDPILCRPGKAQYNVYSGGNEGLKPEKSEQYSIGFRFEPTSSVNIGADLWQVKIRDAVSSVSEQQAFGDPVKYRELFSTFTEPSTGNTYWAYKSLSINIGRAVTRGIDWDFTVRQKFGFGTVTVNGNGTHLLKSDYTLPGTENEWTNSMNFFGINNAVSFRNIARLGVTLETGPLTNVLTANYRNGYTDAEATARNLGTNTNELIRLHVPSYATLDWQGKYAISKTWEVRGGIKNLLDKAPPLSLRASSGHQVGFDPRYADMFGRTFYLSSSMKF